MLGMGPAVVSVLTGTGWGGGPIFCSLLGSAPQVNWESEGMCWGERSFPSVFIWHTFTEHLLSALGMFCVSVLMPTGKTPRNFEKSPDEKCLAPPGTGKVMVGVEFCGSAQASHRPSGCSVLRISE